MFDAVQLPRREGGNPSLELEHRRFHSRQVVAFQKEQLDVLHRLSPGKPVTHNMCGFFVGDVDYYELARELDVASLDYYYNNGPWAERLAGVPYESAQMDLTRSLKKANFWVTETPTGPIGSQFFLRNLRPLEMRRMNFQALGHGADALVWFRWRTCLFGQEQYTHGILGHDGIPGRRYQDVARTAREFHALWPDLEGSVVQSEVAVVYVYDNRWALGIQPNARDFDYLGHLFQYYRALKREGVNVDFVGTHEPLDGYRAVVLPTGYVLTPEYAAKLTAFVANGGVLLATVRSGVKNEDNVPHEMTLPGLLHEVAGVRIDEYEALLERNPVRFEEALGGGVFEADRLCDWIVPESAEVLARHETEHLSAFAAVTVNQFGGGKAYYVGTCFVEDGPVRAIMRRVLDDAGVERPVGLPEGVNACMRQKGPERYLFVMNHNDHAVELDLGRLPPCRELVAGAPAGAMHQIAAGEVSVLHWKA